MLKFSYLTVLFLLIGNVIFGQEDGYWDKDRATYQEIVVNARDVVVLKTEDLPTGTTELVFRITVLDHNQQMANSLVSLLKAIPDPSGISQGSAGAIFLMSKVSGDDKCKYSIFTSAALANSFKDTGKSDKACLYQNNPVSKDAKVIAFEKSLCLQPNTTNLWFAFESTNWIMNQKIVVEVVPWVDSKLSRGWYLPNRKKIIAKCQGSENAKQLVNSDEYCVCVLEKIQKEYKFQEFQQLLEIEKNKKIKDLGLVCLAETGAYDLVYMKLRNEAKILIDKSKYGEAITKLMTIENDKKATASDYLLLGTSYIYTKQYDKAIKFLKLAELKDDTELLIKLNLAHAYLLNGSYHDAKSIYKKYQQQNVTDSLSWKEKIKIDFESFQKVGLNSDDYDNIIRLVN